MPLLSLAEEGNFIQVYDFKVKPGKGDEIIALFNEFDYSDDNLMHRSSTGVEDGLDVADPDRFYLIGEWRSVEGRRRSAEGNLGALSPKFFDLLEERLSPNYGSYRARRPSTSPRSVTQNSASCSASFYLRREDNDHAARIDHRNTHVAEHRG